MKLNDYEDKNKELNKNYQEKNTECLHLLSQLTKN